MRIGLVVPVSTGDACKCYDRGSRVSSIGFQECTLPPTGDWAENSVDWCDAAGRMDHLYEHGATAYAFSLIHPFDASGKPYKMDRAAIQVKASRNEAGLSDD